MKRFLIICLALLAGLFASGCSYSSVRDPSGATITRMSWLQSADIKGFEAERKDWSGSSSVKLDAAKTDPNLAAALEIVKTLKP